MEVFPASVTLVIRALVVSARWAGRARRLALERATAAADASREAALEARVVVLEDMVEQRDAHIAVLQGRLGEERSRKPYPLMERLRIIWLMQYFQIPGRRLKETLGVSRSSVRRWLKGFQEGALGKRNEPKEPVNKTPREIAELIWEVWPLRSPTAGVVLSGTSGLPIRTRSAIAFTAPRYTGRRRQNLQPPSPPPPRQSRSPGPRRPRSAAW